MSESKERACLYKCRICGKTEANPYFYGNEMKAIDVLVQMEHKGFYLCPGHNQRINATSIHFCEDGSIAMSDFQGVILKELGSDT